MPGLGTYRWTCGCCGKTFEGLSLDLAFRLPDAVVALSPAERLGFYVTDDFCSDGRTHYVRSLMEMPIAGRGDAFRWGVWVELDEAGIRHAIEMHQQDAVPGEPSVAGKLGNALPPFPGSLGQAVEIRFRTRALRPTVHALQPGDLKTAQDVGIGMGMVEMLNRPYHSHGATTH